MIGESCNPAAKGAALGNIALAFIRPDIGDMAIAKLFEPEVGPDAERANALGQIRHARLQQPVNELLEAGVECACDLRWRISHRHKQ